VVRDTIFIKGNQGWLFNENNVPSLHVDPSKKILLVNSKNEVVKKSLHISEKSTASF